MAALAGIGIEQRAEPIAGIGAGRRNDPGVAEETVTHAEIQPARDRQVAQGQGIGVMVALGNRTGATGIDSVLQRVIRAWAGRREDHQYQGRSGEQQLHVIESVWVEEIIMPKPLQRVPEAWVPSSRSQGMAGSIGLQGLDARRSSDLLDGAGRSGGGGAG